MAVALLPSNKIAWLRGIPVALRTDPPPPLFLIKCGKLDVIADKPSEVEVLDPAKPEVCPVTVEPLAVKLLDGANRKVLVALAVSCAFHLGIIGFFLNLKDDGVQIAGTEQAGIARFGNAPDDQVSAGEIIDHTEVTNVTLVTMFQAESVETEGDEPIAPVEANLRVEAAKVPATERLQAVEETPVAPRDTIEPLAEASTPEAAEASKEQMVPVDEQATAAHAPIATATEVLAETVKPVDERALAQHSVEPVDEDALEAEEAVAALQDSPVPTPRPSGDAQLETAKPTETEETSIPARTPRKQGAKPKAGVGGQNQADARRGASNGGKAGTSASVNKGAQPSTVAGNAAVSNYPGKVVSKLRRSLRYPAAARRQRLSGEVRVQFTVSHDGGVKGIQVVRSSGSPVLDEAAIDTVRRAAPFPTIPPDAGRSSWPFTVPLAFAR